MGIHFAQNASLDTSVLVYTYLSEPMYSVFLNQMSHMIGYNGSQDNFMFTLFKTQMCKICFEMHVLSTLLKVKRYIVLYMF